MAYRTTVRSRVIASPPEAIWDLVTDPLVRLDDHPTTVEDRQGRGNEVGDSWVEQHGPECDDDRVRWRVSVATPSRRYRIVGHQRGIRQTQTIDLVPVADGTRVDDRVVFGPSVAGRFPRQVLPWLLLITGLLPRLTADEGDIFDGLEDTLGMRGGL